MKTTKIRKGCYSVTHNGKKYEIVQNWCNAEWKLYEMVNDEQVWCDTFKTKRAALGWIA